MVLLDIVKYSLEYNEGSVCVINVVCFFIIFIETSCEVKLFSVWINYIVSPCL